VMNVDATRGIVQCIIQVVGCWQESGEDVSRTILVFVRRVRERSDGMCIM
jgi:hypothetical protein